MSQVCVINIYVPSIQEAVDFYTAVLGFKVYKQYSTKIVSLLHGEVPIVLEESENALYNPDQSVSGVVLALKTEDIYQTVTQLKEHNVEFVVEEPTDCPPGKFISFRDPFGNVLEYLQFIH
ncbi:VOC family protein [Peribacillus saganii]|uniref:VOC family protein n=1 Tax=Peribacillus saganii TaxID=2303992 RepID=A0A372LFY1_9BACI|nr:VOC family protein [Peribacillus saganii]RFU64475.1 VOC family protein [Peribacillus saganii]